MTDPVREALAELVAAKDADDELTTEWRLSKDGDVGRGRGNAIRHRFALAWQAARRALSSPQEQPPAVGMEPAWCGVDPFEMQGKDHVGDHLRATVKAGGFNDLVQIEQWPRIVDLVRAYDAPPAPKPIASAPDASGELQNVKQPCKGN